MVFVGTGLFGKVHKTEKGYFVATQFFHMMFFPLFPIDSYIVTKKKFGQFTGIKIPINKFSRNVAYLRGFLMAGVLGFVPKVWSLLDPAEFSLLNADEMMVVNIAFVMSFAFFVGLIASFAPRKVRLASKEQSDSIESQVSSVAT